MNVILEGFKTLCLVVYYYLEAFVLSLQPEDQRKHKNISGEISLITGAGSGIGRLIALRLAKCGSGIVLWDVNASGLDETKQMIKDATPSVKVHTYVCDVSDRAVVYSTADRVREDVGDVTILVNNAGIVNGTRLLDTPDEKLIKVMEVNAIAHFWTLKAFLPHMVERNHGHIVTISSIAGKVPGNRLVDYCASKYAAVGLHESLEVELRGMGKGGIQMTNICPSFVNTGMFAGAKSMEPFLEPDYVAERVVTAVLLNEHQVFLPRNLHVLLPVFGLLPRKAIVMMERLLQTQEFMSTFVGRNNNKLSQAS